MTTHLFFSFRHKIVAVLRPWKKARTILQTQNTKQKTLPMQITTVLLSLALTVSASSNTPDFNPNGFSRSAIDSWMTCNSGDTCNTPGYKCCVAPADAANGSGKTTCRPSSDCTDYVIPNNNAPNQQPGWIADWQNCSSNSCASSGFTCCVAPNDFNTGKTTCRPSYDCYNPNYQNTGSTGPSTGNTNQGYQNTGTSPTTQSQNSQNTDSTSPQTGDNGAPSFASQYDGTDNANQQGGMSRASSSFVQGDSSTNDNSNAGSYDSYAQDNSVSSSSSCVYGAWACGQDGVTLFQCSYVQGNVLSWRQHSQCQQGLICSNKSGAGGNGFVGCDYPNGGASSGQIGQTNQGNQGQQNNNGNNQGQQQSSSGSCKFGDYTCGQDGTTIYQCSYGQGSGLSWIKLSQCGGGLRCVVGQPAGYVGCN